MHIIFRMGYVDIILYDRSQYKISQISPKSKLTAIDRIYKYKPIFLTITMLCYVHYRMQPVTQGCVFLKSPLYEEVKDSESNIAYLSQI